MQRDVTTIHAAEYALDTLVREQLQRLLGSCFPGFLDDRIYYKQLPHSRLLAYAGTELIGQVGLDHRVIRIGAEVCRVLGLIDLCVDPEHRNKGVGAQLLNAATELATESPNPIDGLLLFADEHAWYQTHGFELYNRHCTWWGIDERKSVTLLQRQFDDCLMLKSIHRECWPDGDIDLLGYMF